MNEESVVLILADNVIPYVEQLTGQFSKLTFDKAEHRATYVRLAQIRRLILIPPKIP